MWRTGGLLRSTLYLGSVLFFSKDGINTSEYLYANFFTLFHCAMEYRLGDGTLGIYFYHLFQRLSKLQHAVPFYLPKSLLAVKICCELAIDFLEDV